MRELVVVFVLLVLRVLPAKGCRPWVQRHSRLLSLLVQGKFAYVQLFFLVQMQHVTHAYKLHSSTTRATKTISRSFSLSIIIISPLPLSLFCGWCIVNKQRVGEESDLHQLMPY